MLSLLLQLKELSGGSKDRLKLKSGVQCYLEKRLTVVQHSRASGISGRIQAAADWALKLSAQEFYRQLATSIESTGMVKLSNLKISGHHSLSWRDTTWLLLQHEELGSIALLQRNFTCEAILFVELDLFVIRREGRLQEHILRKMLRNLVLHHDAVCSYLARNPVFGGINFIFPSPFHTINFGHTALYRLAKDPLLLRTCAWVDPATTWFDPANAFPTVIANLRTVPSPCRTFFELEMKEPMFLIKPGHVYRQNEEPLNRQVELALLAASGAARASVDQGFRLWLGLTSGKRALVNEIPLMMALIELLMQRHHLEDVMIDGWTGSSMPGKVDTGTPSLYASHETEFATMHAAIRARFPQLKVTSLIGFCYEEKLRSALRCSFFCTSAYTASILPSRFCAMRGIVHTSNRSLPLLRMHIHRRSMFVPPNLVEDEPFDEKQDPHETSYSIPVNPFITWVENEALAKLSP